MQSGFWKSGIGWIRGGRRVLVAWALLGALAAARADADPLDLGDRSARWVEVRFEVSPEDQPGELDRLWSDPRRAHLEPDASSRLVHIRIPAREVEAHLRSTGTETVDGSFSDFVWTLDPASGHVLDARLSGRIREHVQIGPFRTAATVQIDVSMTTRSAAGFRSTEGVFGIRTHQFCTPDLDAPATRSDPGCVAVAPIAYDASRGYVNAVGALRAAHAVTEIRAFSPLGEARFSESRAGAPESIVSGPSRADAICSRAFGPGCRVARGG